MNKILLSITTLFVLFIGLVKINAGEISCPAGAPSTMHCYSALFNVGSDLAAKAPSIIPGNNAEVYSTSTDLFDFSKIVFNAASGGTIAGPSDLKKIIIGQLAKNEITNNASVNKGINTLFTNWFTAYCLDYNKKYPLTGLFSSDGLYSEVTNIGRGYAQAVNNDGTFNDSHDWTALDAAIVLASLANDPNLTPVINELDSHFNHKLADINIVRDPSVGSAVRLYADGDITDFYKYLMGQSGGSLIDVGIEYVGFQILEDVKDLFFVASTDASVIEDIVSNYGYASASDFDVKLLPGTLNHNGNYYYALNLNTLKDLAFTKFKTTIDTSSINNYPHVLWIVENSYPTLTLDEALANAGVNRTTLQAQIRALYGLSASADITTYEENVVYGIVQHAIWQVIGDTFKDGKKLGTSLAVSESGGECTGNLCELNKLYTYLVNANVPSTYANGEAFNNKININYPDEGKELVETTDSSFIYGPFKASYTALVTPIDSSTSQEKAMTITITNTDSTPIKILDGDKRVITSVIKDQQFYISVDKNANVGTVTAKLTLDGVTSFDGSANRGRIYNPVTGLVQNALSGGITTPVDLEGNLSLAVNPKTGVQNIALLLMVTLAAFTLGYLVLSYKQKPTVLNQ